MDLTIRSFDGRPEEFYQYNEIERIVSQQDVGEIREIVFVTGNKNKVAELSEHIKTNSIRLTILDIDLPEIQHSDVLKIVEEKCRRAYEYVNESPVVSSGRESKGRRSVLIEDTCLNFKALNGLPGPYIKWFVEAVGPDGLHKMLAGYEDKSAQAVCIYGLMEDDSKIVFCRGSVSGKITAPRGSSWGWDPVFEEQRTGKTFAEMDSAMKFRFSHRSSAISVLKKYLNIIDS